MEISYNEHMQHLAAYINNWGIISEGYFSVHCIFLQLFCRLKKFHRHLEQGNKHMDWR